MKGMFTDIAVVGMTLLVAFLLAASNGQSLVNNVPNVDSVSISPSTPTKYDNLICNALVSDADGNLDYIDFKWYVNSELVRENTRLVYGDSDTESDTLMASFTDASDHVVCEARVYDFERAYNYATHAIHVGDTPTNSIPKLSYVEITPKQPNPHQDLTCSVYATDADDNLDYVIFEWRKNGVFIRQAVKNVMGSSDTASDILEWSNVGSGDTVKCYANAYDQRGSSVGGESLPVIISGTVTTNPYVPTVYGKPVAVLKVNDYYVDRGEMVHFSGLSSYDSDGSVVQYMFDYGDGTQSSWLPEGTYYSYHSYSNTGTYYAKLKVKDNSYIESDWSSPVAIRVGTYSTYGNSPEIDDMDILINYNDDYVNFQCKLDVYDSNDDLEYVKYKWYMDGDLIFTEKDYVDGYSDESASDVNIAAEDDFTVKCEATVYDQDHNYDSEYRTVTGKSTEEACKLSVEKFDYYSYFTDDKEGWAEITLKNSGESAGTLTVKLYIDGSFIDTYKTYMSVDEEVKKTFNFDLSAGIHKVKLESYLPCGNTVIREANLHVVSMASSVFIPDDNYPENGNDIDEINVIVTPKNLDIKKGDGKAVNIVIESPSKKTFEISVDGIDSTWVNYLEEIEVNGRGTLYMYVVPKEMGTYNFTVTVRSGTNVFTEDISLYVSDQQVTDNDANGLTGMIVATEGTLLSGIVILIILVVLITIYFVAGRFKGKTYEEHVYGSEQPHPRTMKGAVSIIPQKARNDVDMSRLLPAAVHKYSDGTSFPKHGEDF